ncbi:MAG TPA: hypothetical protein VMT34_18370 [Aggregatilineales bacterium]|nr:hypothetical protein [Aggregatilineales bacterium]
MSFLTDAANEIEGLKDKVDAIAGQVENAMNINSIVGQAFNGLFGQGSFVGDTASAFQGTIAQSLPSSATNVLEWLSWMVKAIQAVLDTILTLAEGILRVAGAILDAAESVWNACTGWL